MSSSSSFLDEFYIFLTKTIDKVESTVQQLQDLQDYEELLLLNTLQRDDHRLLIRINTILCHTSHQLISLYKHSVTQPTPSDQHAESPSPHIDRLIEIIQPSISLAQSCLDVLFSFCLRYDEETTLELLNAHQGVLWAVQFFAFFFSLTHPPPSDSSPSSDRERLADSLEAPSQSGSASFVLLKCLEIISLILSFCDSKGVRAAGDRAQLFSRNLVRGVLVFTVQQSAKASEDEDPLYVAAMHALLWISCEVPAFVLEALFVEPSASQLGLYIVKLLNRARSEFTFLPCLRLLDTLFESSATARFFYHNDVVVLLDVLVRELVDRLHPALLSWQLSVLSGVVHHFSGWQDDVQTQMQIKQAMVHLLIDKPPHFDAMCESLANEIIDQIDLYQNSN